MFERYTEGARRTLFTARNEAIQLGSPSIDSMHVLLGLIREARDVTARVLETADCSLDNLRADILSHVPAHASGASGEVPFTDNVKRILNAAAHEAEQMDSRVIGAEHLLLGILSKDDSIAIKILDTHGIRLDDARQRVAAEPEPDRRALVTDAQANILELQKLTTSLQALAREQAASEQLRHDIFVRLDELKLHILYARKIMTSSDASRVVWQQEHVVDVDLAAFAARTYLEQRDARALWTRAIGGRRRHAACEIGAGFGRMTVLLTEFFDEVTGFEREGHFVHEAARLHPSIRFVHVDALTRLPAPDAAFDGVMTFTVLQHLTNAVAAQAAAEIVRVLKPGGHLLICEETDPDHQTGATDDANGTCTIGRPVSEYQAMFSGFTLIETRRRRIEPTYPRPNVGTFMLFRKPE